MTWGTQRAKHRKTTQQWGGDRGKGQGKQGRSGEDWGPWPHLLVK
jgi:hypothetical protein